MDISELKKRITHFINHKILNASIDQYNEEKTKMILILPFFKDILGYSDIDFEPEYNADQNPKNPQKVDYAIMIQDQPRILIEAKSVGTFTNEKNFNSCHGQLASYFSQVKEGQVGVLTDGVHYYFYNVDDNKRIMQKKCFFHIDMSQQDISNYDIETLISLRKESYNSNNIDEHAKKSMIRTALHKMLTKNFDDPSEEFLEFMLRSVQDIIGQRITANIKETYKGQIQSACKDFINHKIQSVFNQAKQASEPVREAVVEDSKIITTEGELKFFEEVKSCLIYSLKDDQLVEEAKKIEYKDYIGHFKVFYKGTVKGNLIEFVEDKMSIVIPALDYKATIDIEKIYLIKDQLIEAFKKIIH